MILITGAAGKTGRAIIRQLMQKGQHVRAFVRREAHVETMQALGIEDIFVGDLHDPQAVSAAMVGARAVYHICPNVNPDEFAIGKIAIDAAVEAGVAHFVFHSVLHPQVKQMPHHWEKLRVEEYLFQSRLPFTILQPVAYMQNILGQWDSIRKTGKYRVPYSVHTRLGMVDLEDVATAASIVLTEAGHIGATYELATGERLSQIEVAAVLTDILGQPVSAERIPLAEWEAGARKAGLGEYQVRTLRKMFANYDQFDFWGNGRVLEMLLGHKPILFSEFAHLRLDLA